MATNELLPIDSEGCVQTPEYDWDNREDALDYIERLTREFEDEVQQDLLRAYMWFTILTVGGLKYLSALRNGRRAEEQELRFLAFDEGQSEYSNSTIFSVQGEYRLEVYDAFASARSHIAKLRQNLLDAATVDASVSRSRSGCVWRFPSAAVDMLRRNTNRDDDQSGIRRKHAMFDGVDAICDQTTLSLTAYSPVAVQNYMSALVDTMELVGIPKEAVSQTGSAVLHTLYRSVV